MEDHNCKEQGLFHAKYAQPSGQEQRLFNVAAYFSGLNILGVCEGEIDAITATVHLGIPTIGIPGAQQWKANSAYWRLVLRDFETVIIFADGDTDKARAQPDGTVKTINAARDFIKSVANDAGPYARIVHCPDGEDVNSMVVAERGEELKRKAGL
jgi:hypothetical protein